MSRERSFAWMYPCFGSRVAEWFHMSKNEGGGEERPNKTPPYAVYLDSIRTPSGYANSFCLVCLAVCSRCSSVHMLPWCWSHGVLHNSQRTLLFIFPQRWSCSMCVRQNMPPSAFCLIDGTNQQLETALALRVVYLGEGVSEQSSRSHHAVV